MRENTKCLKALCGIVGGGAERLEELVDGATLNRHRLDMTWHLHTRERIAVGLAVQTYTRFGLSTFHQGSGKS